MHPVIHIPVMIISMHGAGPARDCTVLENSMNEKIPRAFIQGLLIAFIAVLLLPSAVTADSWGLHYELNTDRYHPGDNGTLLFSYDGDMDVRVYFMSMTIEGVGIYEVTPNPPYEYKTGGKPLVVTLPFSIPVTVKPGDYQYSYEFDRGGGHPVQRGTSTIKIVASGEPGSEQASGQNQNDSLPTPLIILVLLLIIIGYLAIRRKTKQNSAGEPNVTAPAVSRFSPRWRMLKIGAGLIFLLVWFVLMPAAGGINPLFLVILLFMPPFCFIALPAFLIAIYLLASRKIRRVDFVFIAIVILVAGFLILSLPGFVSGLQTQQPGTGNGYNTCTNAGETPGAVCPTQYIRLQVSNREIGSPVLEYSSKSGIYPVVEIRDDSRFALRITLIAPDAHVVHEETFDVRRGGQGNVDFNAGRNLSLGNYSVEFHRGGELLASIPVQVRY